MAAAALLIVTLSAGCRFHSKDPYWIETHGHAIGNRIAGWALGVLLLGYDSNLWGYPGSWNNPWEAKARTQPLRAIAAAHTAVYALLADGHVARFTGSSWQPIEGSPAWNTSEFSVTADDRLLLITGGKLRAVVRQVDLEQLSCDEHPNLVGVAATGPDEAFVIDQEGLLYFNGDGKCNPIAAPVKFRRIAANTNRLVGVAADGSVWRRRNGSWAKLPMPYKYRPGLPATVRQPYDVGLSEYSSWLVDIEGSVYVLSDET